MIPEDMGILYIEKSKVSFDCSPIGGKTLEF